MRDSVFFTVIWRCLKFQILSVSFLISRSWYIVIRLKNPKPLTTTKFSPIPIIINTIIISTFFQPYTHTHTQTPDPQDLGCAELPTNTIFYLLLFVNQKSSAGHTGIIKLLPCYRFCHLFVNVNLFCYFYSEYSGAIENQICNLKGESSSFLSCKRDILLWYINWCILLLSKILSNEMLLR